MIKLTVKFIKKIKLKAELNELEIQVEEFLKFQENFTENSYDVKENFVDNITLSKRFYSVNNQNIRISKSNFIIHEFLLKIYLSSIETISRF